MEVSGQIDLQLELGARIATALENLKKTNLERRTQGYLVAKRKEFDDYFNRLTDGHTKLYTSVPASSRKSVNYFTDKVYDSICDIVTEARIKIEEWYLVAIATHTMPATSAFPESLNNTMQHPARSEQLRLPRIKIDAFSGDYHKWVSFKNLFIGLIHNKEDIPAVEKFHHLIANLSGEPKNMISHYAITADNYDSAWEMLLSRYDNQRVLVNTELKTILNLQKLSNESAGQIKQMVDKIVQSTNALRNLKINIATWDPILVYIFTQKLDAETNKHWLNSAKDPKAVPSLKEFLECLENRFQALESSTEPNSHHYTPQKQWQNFKPSTSKPFQQRSTSSYRAPSNRSQHNAQSNQSSFNQRDRQSSNTRSGALGHSNPFRQTPNNSERDDRAPRTFVVSTASKCPACENNHAIFDCNSFKSMTIKQRKSFSTEHGLCTNCLKNHNPEQCTSASTCKHCKFRHNTLLHESSDRNSADHQTPTTSTQAIIRSHAVTENAIYSPSTQILLATALIKVPDRHGELHTMRCLLDQGSQASFITRAAAQILGQPLQSIVATVSGIGASRAAKLKSQISIEIQSIYNKTAIPITALVLDRITDQLPATHLFHADWSHISGLQLADPKYYSRNKIDLLLGAEVYSCIIMDGVKRGVQGAPVAQRTQFGWILSGAIEDKYASQARKSIEITSLHHRIDIDRQLKAFWEIEEVQQTRTLSKEEADCEAFFYETVSRDSAGRFTVGLPFKAQRTPLGQSRYRALTRLNQLHKKFEKLPQFYSDYSAVIEGYKESSHMKSIRQNQIYSEHYYMPHHAVIKEASTTTKLRVVFDASAKTTTGESLNEQLLVGPQLQQDLASILMRWRIHEVILAADITQMYRQIRVRETETKFQRILWYDSNNQPQEYELSTLTFGTSPAAYLAVKTLQHLAKIEEGNHPIASTIILRDFYVDDLMTGADSTEDAIFMYQEIMKVLAKGGFELRKWISNKAEVLQRIPQSSRELVLPLSFDVDSTTKTLGMHYHPATDKFQFKVHQSNYGKPPTKRILLSDISKLFDPLGLAAPITIKAKIFLQRLWQKDYDWDQIITGTLKEDWYKFRTELKELETIQIDRWLGLSGSQQDIQVHGFCDASERAYAAAVYTRFRKKNGEFKIALVTAKTRVAPLKTISLPRLELCGAVLLAKLIASTKRSLQLQDAPTFTWTDSEIVLAWISGQPTRWKTFVANRVVEILQYTHLDQWRHVSSHDNPADCASRGLFPAELGAYDLWWSGPTFLKSDEWRLNDKINRYTTEIEQKTATMCTLTTSDEETIVDRFSSLVKLLRVVASIHRFCFNCRYPSLRRTGVFTIADIEESTITCIKIAQLDFKNEIHHLTKHQQITSNSSISSLNPFLDQHHLLRVGGRIGNADIHYNQRHPILLSASNNLARLIITDAHIRTQHGGVQVTTTIIRRRYWIVRARNSVKKVIHQCIICHRHNNAKATQLMAPLPKSRLTINRPFTNTGVDYAGPIDVRVAKGRSTRSYKGYIALFVCFATKAVHLEVVSDLTTQAFLAAFRRFVARRGLPLNMYSDNGTNFVGADRVLMKLVKAAIQHDELMNYTVTQGINWHFIPARSPHFGGLWEAGIKQVKRHLVKVVKNATLTFEELTTVLNQIEASLNSRPLTPLSEDPADFSALTPGHFLTGSELLAPPAEKLDKEKMGTLSSWRRLSQLHQHFWKRWREEYITGLQQRYKWKKMEKECKQGDMVLLKEDNQPPNRWRLGRIQNIHPGRDGHVRVVTVNTQNGQYQRAINKIAVLPIDN